MSDSARSDPGPFSPRVYDRVRALRVLACAEFERYFEERAYSVALKARDNKLKTPANEMVRSALCASYLTGFVLETSVEVPRAKIARNFFEVDYASFLNQAIVAYEKAVKDNHGVRDDNLRAILRPIAFRFEAIDPLFLPEVTTFAKQRGEIAHIGVCVTMQLDPKTELAKLSNLLSLAESIDPIFENPAP